MSATISDRAVDWITSCDTGQSSKCLWSQMMGRRGNGDFPWDPSDLGRCLRLLALIPEWKPRINEMVVYGPQWAALVAHWPALELSMSEEVGIGWSKARIAPKTYALMKEVLNSAMKVPA